MAAATPEATREADQGQNTMARSDTLSCLQMRDILNRPVASAASLIDRGEALERAGRVHDALSFYEKAGAHEGIRRLRDGAAREGDLFLYRRTCRALGEEPTPEDWIAVGKRAADLGKTAFAHEAFRLAGREDLISGPSSLSTTPSQ